MAPRYSGFCAEPCRGERSRSIGEPTGVRPWLFFKQSHRERSNECIAGPRFVDHVDLDRGKEYFAAMPDQNVALCAGLNGRDLYPSIKKTFGCMPGCIRVRRDQLLRLTERQQEPGWPPYPQATRRKCFLQVRLRRLEGLPRTRRSRYSLLRVPGHQLNCYHGFP